VFLVPSVHSLEPATVDRDHGLGEQFALIAVKANLPVFPRHWPMLLVSSSVSLG
jgi:hypothetical protein